MKPSFYTLIIVSTLFLGTSASAEILNLTDKDYTISSGGSTPAENTGFYVSQLGGTLNDLSIVRWVASGSSGSGTFTRLYSLQSNTGSQRAYNNAVSSTFDQKRGVSSGQHSFGNLPVYAASPQTGGRSYFEFLIDINDADEVSIDQFMLFATPTSTSNPNVGAGIPTDGSLESNFNSQGATLLYDFNADFNADQQAGGVNNVAQDHFLLTEIGSGSGAADYVVFLPTEYLDNAYGGVTPTEYSDYRFWAYIEMGNFTGVVTGGNKVIDFTTDGGFDEFAFNANGVTEFTPTGIPIVIPEASTLVLQALFLSLFAAFFIRRKKQS